MPRSEEGVVRGLLCDSCNPGIGQLGDTAGRLELAFEYPKNSERRWQEAIAAGGHDE